MSEDAHLVALVERALQAVKARPAGAVKATQDAVTALHSRDGVARLDHRAHELVADREAGLDLHPPVVDVEIRAADAAGLDGHDRIVRGLERWIGALLHLNVAGSLEGDGSHSQQRVSVRDTSRR